MTTQLHEPLHGAFRHSRILILNFDDIPLGTPADESIALYFQRAKAAGGDPKLPTLRQKFNNRVLDKTGARYLIGQYLEDRASMLVGSEIHRQGRTLHLGIDVFCKELEAVYAPCDGTIVRIGQEPEDHSFGHFLILKPADSTLPYLLFGHLDPYSHEVGPIRAKEQIATIGDYKNNENGGWSRHLHLQMMRDLPAEDEALLGYAPTNNTQTRLAYPDPMKFFKDWHPASSMPYLV